MLPIKGLINRREVSRLEEVSAFNSEGTVKSRLARAKKNLKEIIKDGI